MNVEVKKLSKNEVELTVTVEPAEYAKFEAEALAELSAGVELPGFRAGKAPKDMLEAKIGKEKLVGEAIHHMLSATYYDAIVQEKLHTISQPEFDVKEVTEGQPIVYTAKVTLLPEVEMGDYKTLKVKKEPVEVKPGQEEEIIKDLQKRAAGFKDIERGAQIEDRVEINFEGSIDGIKQDRLCSENYPLILGKGVFIPGFEEHIIGLTVGGETEFDITFPADYYAADLAGKQAHFKIKLNSVKEVVLPELDEEFTKNWGAKDLEELRSRIKESLVQEAKSKEDEQYMNAVVEKVVDQAKAEIPSSLIEQEQDNMLHEMKHDVAKQGMEFAKYLETVKKTEQELKDSWKEFAEKRVKTNLVIAKVRELEQVEVSKEEVMAEIERLANNPQTLMQNPEEAEKLRTELLTEKGQDYVKHILMNRKAVEKLMEYASN